MQAKMCTKCKKNIAVVFITKVENGVTMNEGYCLRCARSLGIPQIDQAVKSMGISEDDLDLLTDEAGVILLAAIQNLDHTLGFHITADDLIQLAGFCATGQIHAVRI